MLEEVYFIDKKQVHAYVVNGIKIYLDECYWQTTKQGTEKRDIKTGELLDCKTIDKAVSEIWKNKEKCKVDLD